MMAAFAIRALTSSPEVIDALTDILVETVANGGSVTFMHPLDPDEARLFWTNSLAAAERGERVLFGAFENQTLIGTVTLHLDCPPNQPHRAEIAKMMTRVSHRGRGIGSALLREAERVATENGKTLLVLDTAQDEGASGFYQKLGYNFAGSIPDYALKPHGGLTGTMLFWKKLAPAVD